MFCLEVAVHDSGSGILPAIKMFWVSIRHQERKAWMSYSVKSSAVSLQLTLGWGQAGQNKARSPFLGSARS